MKGFPNFIIPHDSLGIAVTMPGYNSQKFGFLFFIYPPVSKTTFYCQLMNFNYHK